MPETKVLLVGPCPPPHGGISVHVAALARELEEGGAVVRRLNLDRRAPSSPEYLTQRGPRELLRIVRAHARDGFAVHVHTSGHTLKSWLVVLACAQAGTESRRAVLTLHSGMLPEYLSRAGFLSRALVRRTCRGFARIVCVSRPIRNALVQLGVPAERLVVRPAFLRPRAPSASLPPRVAAWMSNRWPLLSAALFFRPEYGVDLLVDAVARLRLRYPAIGCVLMGSGDAQDTAALIRRRGLQGTVEIVGDLEHGDCLNIMARSHVFVRPTRADGDSISVREALALGVRTVASEVGTRPAGVHLFPAGSVDGLVSAVSRALAAPTPGAETPVGDEAGLLELYVSNDDHPGGLDARTVLRG